jgi:hypothetical protein
MTFEEALVHLKTGSNISRKCDMWNGYFLALTQDEGDSIQLFDINGWVDCGHCVSNSDLLAEDWWIVE